MWSFQSFCCQSTTLTKKHVCVPLACFAAINHASRKTDVWTVVLFYWRTTSSPMRYKCGRLCCFAANRPQFKKNRSVVGWQVFLPTDHKSKKTKVWSIDSFGCQSTTVQKKRKCGRSTRLVTNRPQIQFDHWSEYQYCTHGMVCKTRKQNLVADLNRHQTNIIRMKSSSPFWLKAHRIDMIEFANNSPFHYSTPATQNKILHFPKKFVHLQRPFGSFLKENLSSRHSPI